MVNKSVQKQNGNSNVNQDGDGNYNIRNQYNFSGGSRILAPTKLFAMLKIFLDSKIEPTASFSLDLPAGLYYKLDYNNSPKYSNIFMYSLEDYKNIDTILKDNFANSQLIIQKMQVLFFNHCSYDENNKPIPDNGDCILDNIAVDIKEQIMNDPRFMEYQISIDELEQFIIAFLQYGVAECKILVNPDQK